MSKIVFVLGAGASAHCGTPLMEDFLDVARDLPLTEPDEKAHFDEVFKAIGNLRQAQSKAMLNIDNIEIVFTAFEMGKLLGRLPGVENSSDLEKLISSLKKVISYTLERTTKFPGQRGQIPSPPKEYNMFAHIIDLLLKERRRDCAIITFNYDLGLDYALWENKILLDYGLDDSSPAGKSVTYLKLHGSLNWAKCKNKECWKIIPIQEFDKTQDTGAGYSIIPILDKVRRKHCSGCGELVGEDPLIVPPTWNKTASHDQIDRVWKRAALELKDAESIFVLGYSLPPTDWFFNYLFALGVDMRTPVGGFYVYNPDSEVDKRFQKILGQSMISKYAFYPIKFEEAILRQVEPQSGINIKTLHQNLNIQEPSDSNIIHVRTHGLYE